MGKGDHPKGAKPFLRPLHAIDWVFAKNLVVLYNECNTYPNSFMSTRHSSRSVLHVALVASTIVSVGLATATTAQLLRNKRNIHRAASEVMNVVPSERDKLERTEEAAKERAGRQDIRTRLHLRNLRLGE